MIYLDSAATTEVSDVVLKEMIPYFSEKFGNPGSVHSAGFEAKKAMDEARDNVAEFFGMTNGNIIFTSSGSEANNIAIEFALQKMVRSGKRRILVSAVEHNSVMAFMEDLKMRLRYQIEYVFPDASGVIKADAVRAKITGDTGLVCVMYANNETGAINEVEEIGELCKEHGSLFMVDCVQAAGVVDIDVDAMHCDFATVSSHKIHGPKGAGALYCRDIHNSPQLEQFIYGGADQEYGLRGGTENIPAIVGFGTAIKLINTQIKQNNAHILLVKTMFYRALQESMHERGIGHIMRMNFNSVPRVGKIVSLTFDGIDAESLVLAMSAAGVCISAGSACNSRETIPSHVLMACGMHKEEAMSTVRVSFSDTNTVVEAKEAAKIMAEVVWELYSYSNSNR